MARAILIGVIRFYRRAVSPFTPPACRFQPTCSAYALEAVERHGAGRGGWLALRRLLRCHPFGGSGWDPVPPAPGGEGKGGTGRAGDGRTDRSAMEADARRAAASRPRVERRWTGDR